MNSYEAKQEARRERLLARADKLQRESAAMWSAADKMWSAIPFGQPILVGHYSEKRDRNYRERAFRKMVKSSELEGEANRARAKAEAVGTGGISQDDPEAVTKLLEKIADAKSLQEYMKKANRAVRKALKKAEGDKPAAINALVDDGYRQDLAAKLVEGDFCGRVGFPDYRLQNNNANIRRMEKRVKELRAAAEREDIERKAGDIVMRVADNRVQLAFPGKPGAEVRARLKAAGFRWAPSRGVWQAFVNWSTQQFAENLLAEQEAA